ncbi:MAG: o-succinylbenzoate synthase [Muribaculaceae bacterium]
MKATYAPYSLHFINPGGTSRGVLTEKQTYFLKIWDESNPLDYGIGECAIFRGLSKEDNPHYEEKLQELCRNIENNEATDLAEHSSIKFGLEGAILDFTNGCNRLNFPSKFTDGEQRIPINGLVWMGTKDEMLGRIDAKIAAGFHTLKLKIGAIDFNSELAMIDHIRCNYSPEKLEIRLDANGGFTPDNAIQRLEKLSHFDIHSIEQPIKAGQWNEMAYLCANSQIAIAIDEELIGITDTLEMNELLRTISPKYIILKPSLIGGISGAEDWIKLAAQYDIGGWVTSALESNIGLNTIAQWVSTLEVKIPQGLGTGNLYDNNIISPLEQKEDYLCYNPCKKWVIPDFDWK